VNVARLSGNLKYIQRCKIRCDTDLSGMNNNSLQNINKNNILLMNNLMKFILLETRGPQTFQKSRSYLKILDITKVTSSLLRTHKKYVPKLVTKATGTWDFCTAVTDNGQ